MPFVGHLGAPVFVPPIAHAFLWPALLGWAVFLVRQRRRRAWPCVGSFGVSLVPACLLTDGAALLAAIKYPDPQYNSLVFTLLWLAVLFSVTAYFALRTPDDGGWSDDEPEEDFPEPPWWPDFERDLRDYMRRGPRRPAKPPRLPDRPKAPAGVP